MPPRQRRPPAQVLARIILGDQHDRSRISHQGRDLAAVEPFLVPAETAQLDPLDPVNVVGVCFANDHFRLPRGLPSITCCILRIRAVSFSSQ